MHLGKSHKKIIFALYTVFALFGHQIYAKTTQKKAKQEDVFAKLYNHIDKAANEFNKATNEIQIKQIENNLTLELFKQFPEAQSLTQDAVVSPGSTFNKTNPNLLQNRIPELKQATFGNHAAEFERTMTSMINHAKNLALYKYLTQKNHTTLTHYQAHIKHLGITDRFTKTDQDVQNRFAFLKQVYADQIKVGKVGYLTLINDLFKVETLAKDFSGREHDQAAVAAIAHKEAKKYFPSLKTATEIAEIKLLLQANEFATLAQINQGEAPALGLQGLWNILNRADLVEVTVMEQLLDISGAPASASGPVYHVITPLEKSLASLPASLKESAQILSTQNTATYQEVYRKLIESKFPQGLKPQDMIEARFMAMIRLDQKQPTDAVEQLNAFREARANLKDTEQKQLNHLLDPQTNIMVMYAPDFMSNVQSAVNSVTVNKHPYLVQGYQFALQRMIRFAAAASYLHDQSNSLSVVNIKDAVVPAKQILTHAVTAQEKGQSNYQEVLQKHPCMITSFSGGELSLDHFKSLLKAQKSADIVNFVGKISSQPELLATIQATMYQSDNPEVINLLKDTRHAKRLFLGAGGGSDPLSAAAFASNNHPNTEMVIVGSSRHCPADLQTLIEQARAHVLYLNNQNGIVVLQGDGLLESEDSIPDFHRTSKIETSLGLHPIPVIVMNRSLNVFDQADGSEADQLIKALAKYLVAYHINNLISVDTGCDINGLGKLESQNQMIDAIEGDIKHAVIMDAAIARAKKVYNHDVAYTIQAVAPGIDNQTTKTQQEVFIKKYHLTLNKLPISYFEDLYTRTAQQAVSRTAKQIAIIGKFFAQMTPEQQKALKKYLKLKKKKEKDLHHLEKSFQVIQDQSREHEDFVAILGRMQLQGDQIMYQTQDRRESPGQLLDLNWVTSYVSINHKTLQSIIKNNYQPAYARQVLEAHINHLNQLEKQVGQEPTLKQAYTDAKQYVLSIKNGKMLLVNIAAKNPSKGAINLIKAVGKDVEKLFEDSVNKRLETKNK